MFRRTDLVSGPYGPVLYYGSFYQFGSLGKEFRERFLGFRLWSYDHPGFWPRGWSQELNGRPLLGECVDSTTASQRPLDEPFHHSKTPRGGSRTICIMDTNEHASDWRNQHLGKWHSSEFQSLFEPTHTAKRLSWPLV